MCITLVYCAGGNPRLSQIAYDAGWKLGMRSDEATLDLPQTFIDIDYKRPDWQRHVSVVAKYRPKYATIPDLSDLEVSTEDVERALRQREEIAPYCEIPLVVPKLAEQLAMLPKEVAIGYSVPSSYGGVKFSVWEVAQYLEGRRVHLLGGSPKKQIEAYLQLSPYAYVGSADSNYHQLMATRYGEYWEKHQWVEHEGVKSKQKDIYFECWQWSCENLLAYWRSISAVGL